jgi:hypothetical protein
LRIWRARSPTVLARPAAPRAAPHAEPGLLERPWAAMLSGLRTDQRR